MASKNTTDLVIAICKNLNNILRTDDELHQSDREVGLNLNESNCLQKMNTVGKLQKMVEYLEGDVPENERMNTTIRREVLLPRN